MVALFDVERNVSIRTPSVDRWHLTDLDAVDAETRAQRGHWEANLIVGKDSASVIGNRGGTDNPATLRPHLPEGRHDAAGVAEAMIAKISQLPGILRQTLTWDQDIEMTNQARIAAGTNLEIYFWDPHSPWQRPTNETPTASSASTSPRASTCPFRGSGYLDQVATELNDRRPRKALNWRTAAEALHALLSNPSHPPGAALAD